MIKKKGKENNKQEEMSCKKKMSEDGSNCCSFI